MTTDQADSGSKPDPAEGKAQGGGGAPNRERSHGRSSLRRLLDFAGPRKVFSYLGCGLSALSTIAGLGPYICIWLAVKDLLAVAPGWSQATEIAIYGWLGFGFAAASVFLYCAGLLMTHLAAFRSASNMRKAAIGHLLSLPLGYFDLHASGELRRTIDGSAGDTENLLAHILPDAAGSFAMILGMPILMLVFDWRMGLACLFPILIALVCIRVMMNDQGQSFMTEYQDALVRMSKTGTEYVRGIPVVKVFQQTVYSFKAFHEAIEHYSRIARNYAMQICHLPQTIQMTALNGTVIFLIPVAILLASGQSDFTSFVADFAFYAVFSGMVPTAMTRLQFSSESFSKADDALDRIAGVLSSDPLTVADEPERPKSADASLEHASYTYPGADLPALDRIDFKVPEGGMVALGGIDVRSIDPHDLMGQVAFVFQTNRLFSTTLLENVRAARPDAAPEQVMEALRAAQCMDIVDKLPEGLDTMLGSGGIYLSGGEVQRVALARAILKESPIVVLDEATAFADPENEFLIQKALTKLTRGEGGRRRTVLMIAHRLSTVAHVDRILVLDGGHLVEQGTHRQLLDVQGTYARIWSDYERAVSWKVDNSPKAAAGAGQNPAGPIAGEKHVVPGVGPFATDSSTGDSDIQRKGGEA